MKISWRRPQTTLPPPVFTLSDLSKTEIYLLQDALYNLSMDSYKPSGETRVQARTFANEIAQVVRAALDS